MSASTRSAARLGDPAGPRGAVDLLRPRIPTDHNEAMVELDGHRVRLTNLRKVLWPQAGVTKGMLLQYYLDVAWVALPHLAERPMVMKRYPNGVSGKYFVMKRAPSPRPKWIRTCTVAGAASGGEFAVVDDSASLAWAVNLGCIELHPWPLRCGDVERPDVLLFDIDPGDAPFELAREASLLLHAALDRMQLANYVKTSGDRGLHVVVPIEYGPLQRETWAFARVLAREIAEEHPKLLTSGTAPARTAGRVSIDYGANVRGHTLASVYSVRAASRATVSTPVTWEEVEQGFHAEQFRVDNVPARLRRVGDLWAPLSPDAPSRSALPRAEA